MSHYQNALDVQSASNLSGVVLQFARDMKAINAEVRASGGGTDQVNTHTSCRHPQHGFAITEEGECQIVVSAFRRVGCPE